MKTKICSKCKIELNIKEFNNNIKEEDGLQMYCKKCNKQYQKDYYRRNKQKIDNNHKKYYKTYKIKINKKRKEYRKQYYLKNKKRLTQMQLKKLKNNLEYRIKTYLRIRLYHALKGNSKSSTTMKLVGCSIKQLKQHLERQFKNGMSWDNYGKWHIDHIKPCCTFDLSKINEQKKCFNYKNLQPLWAKDNLSKNKY